MHTRPVTRTRTVPHTINGQTRMVLEEYTEHIPAPPRDWDRIVLNAATVVSGTAVLAAVGWSITGVGGLLDHAAPAAAAYVAAGCFDAGWIVALAMEWLARHDPARARRPRRAGHFALAIAMAALGANGWLNGGLAVALAAAAVSALAKGMWTLVLGHHARPLDNLTQQWVDQVRTEAGVEFALAATNRELARTRGITAAVRAAYELPTGQPADTTLDTSPIVSPAVRAAVRTAADTMPGATPQDLAGQLSAARIPVSARTVRIVLDEPDEPDDEELTPPTGRLHAVPTPPAATTPSLSDAVRDALRTGDPGESAVFAAVREVIPDAKANSVARIYRRYRPKAS